MAETCTRLARARRFGDQPRTLGHKVTESLTAGLLQHPHEIDHVVGPRDRASHRRGIAQISLHRVDLPDGSQRLEEEGAFRPARRDPDPVAASYQRLHHVAPEKTRSRRKW